MQPWNVVCFAVFLHFYSAFQPSAATCEKLSDISEFVGSYARIEVEVQSYDLAMVIDASALDQCPSAHRRRSSTVSHSWKMENRFSVPLIERLLNAVYFLPALSGH